MHAQNRPAHVKVATISVACTLTLLCSCGESGGGKPIAPTSPPRATPRMLGTGMPALEDVPNRPLYAINVTLDYANGSLTVQERVEFKNPSNVPLRQIKFNVPPARHPNAITVKDARVFGQPANLRFDPVGTALIVTLPALLPTDAAIALTFDYTLKLPPAESMVGAIGGDDSSSGPNALIAGHWYLMLAPWRDGNWDTPGFYPVGDSYNDELADYDVTILAPDGVTVAGAGDEQHNGRQWRYSLRNARVFAFGASDQFAVEKDDIVIDGIEIYHYALKKHANLSGHVLITAERALKLFGQLYGPYPYKTLRIIETDRAQGQEYSAVVGLGSVLYERYPGGGSRHDLIASTAHEISHQWWFQTVGNDQIKTPWLDESFARMAEVKFYEAYYPNDVDWWMENYLRSKKPTGAIDGTLGSFGDSQAYLNGVYRRGAMFLLDVRTAMGTTAFDAAMKDYFVVETDKITNANAFFDALARNSNADLSVIVRDYFANPPVLPCKISANAPGCRK